MSGLTWNAITLRSSRDVRSANLISFESNFTFKQLVGRLPAEITWMDNYTFVLVKISVIALLSDNVLSYLVVESLKQQRWK